MAYAKTWEAGLSEYQKNELSKELKTAENVLKRLEEMLDKKLTSAIKDQMAVSQYENPNWSHKQADSIGYQRALNEVINLLHDRK